MVTSSVEVGTWPSDHLVASVQSPLTAAFHALVDISRRPSSGSIAAMIRRDGCVEFLECLTARRLRRSVDWNSIETLAE